jgi:hypothetical protein
MQKNNPNRNDVILTATFLSSALFLMMACNQITQLLTGPSTAIPDGYQKVTSTHKSYEYLIPDDWTKTGFNSYEGDNGSLIEEIYPPATITEEYCQSFVSPSGSNYTVTVVENRIYDNGHIQGCYMIRDILNTELNKEWRATSFSFMTDRGVESLSIRVEKQNCDKAQILTIIDSIRIK